LCRCGRCVAARDGERTLRQHGGCRERKWQQQGRNKDLGLLHHGAGGQVAVTMVAKCAPSRDEGSVKAVSGRPSQTFSISGVRLSKEQPVGTAPVWRTGSSFR